MSGKLSVLLYFTVGVSCILAAKNAKKRPKFSFWFIVIVLSLLAGLRHASVGIDTPAYVDLLSQLETGWKNALNNIDEKGFILLSYLMAQITDGYTWLLLAFAFITNFFIVKRLFEARDYISFPWAIFIYYCQYYFMTFNIMRQWIALAIIFYFSKYIGEEKKGTLKFVIAVIIATLMHKTSLLALAIVLIYYFVKKSKNIYQTLAKIITVVVTPILLISLYLFILSRYPSYKIEFNGDISYINVLRVGVILLLLFFCVIRRKQIKLGQIQETAEEAAIRKRMSFETVVALVGSVLTLLVAFSRYADRAAMCFIVFEMTVFPYYIKKKGIGKIVALFVFVLFMFLRYKSFTSIGQGEIPYLPFWAMIS